MHVTVILLRCVRFNIVVVVVVKSLNLKDLSVVVVFDIVIKGFVLLFC